MAAYPWQRTAAKPQSPSDRCRSLVRLDCTHAVTKRHAQRCGAVIDCPACFRAWWDTPGNRNDRMLRLPAWRRLYDLAHPEPPPIGVRPVPVQVDLLPLEAA